MKPELYLSDARRHGQADVPVHTAGSVGGTTGIVAASHVQAGKHKTVLAVAFEKQSEGNAVRWQRGASAGGAFAPSSAPIHCSGAPEHIGWKVAVKDRQNALKNPLRLPQDRGHLDREGEGVADALGADPLPRVLPVVRRRLRRGPHRRGGRKAAAADGRAPAWILGVVALRAAELPGPRPAAARWPPACAQDVYDQAGITNPREQIAWPSCTCRSRGTRRSGSKAHGIADPGEG